MSPTFGWGDIILVSVEHEKSFITAGPGLYTGRGNSHGMTEKLLTGTLNHKANLHSRNSKAVVGGRAGPALAGPLFWPKKAGPQYSAKNVLAFLKCDGPNNIKRTWSICPKV